MIYQPAEDSYFLCEIISDYLIKLTENQRPKIKVLDMGTGSGIQTINCLKNKIKKQNITAIDINPDAIKETKKLKIKSIKSDLFSKVNKNSQFDLIIFNPPYLPEHKYDNQKDTTGGKKGDETIIKFIKQLNPHLSNNGVCFLLTSSLTPESAWKSEAKKQNLKIKLIASKNLFQEKLFIWKIIL
jgi:release factor glutamine methyltransferase